jgi:hypothetical protein
MQRAADLLTETATEAAIAAAATGTGPRPVLPRRDLQNHDLLNLVQLDLVRLDMARADLAATQTASGAVRLPPSLRVPPNRPAAIRVRSSICGSRLRALPMAVPTEGRAATVDTVAITLPVTEARAQVMEAVIPAHPAAGTLPVDIRTEAVVATPAVVVIQAEAAMAVVVIGNAKRAVENLVQL